VKSKLIIVGAVAVLGATAWLTNHLLAQQPGVAPAAMPQQTKVATINMAVVTKGYKKFEFFMKELDDLEKPYRDKAQNYAKLYKDWQAVLQNPNTPEAKRDEAQKNLLTLKRLIEDNNTDASKAIGSRRNEKLVQIYREIHDAVSRYAVSNGIHIVMQYIDPVTETDIFTPQNIDRKLKSAGAGAFAPMYLANGLDISQGVVNYLNGPAAAAAAPRAGPGGQ
jgi:Skp family chaperone for outer membrane proteins